jgi:hypothetical protein
VFSVETARKFIFQLKNEAKFKYNIDLNLNNVIEEALRIMEQSGNFSECEIVTVREFYTQLFSQSLITTRECHSKFFKKKQKKSETLNRALCKVDQEFMLPDHMAWGYILLLGGALLCLIPTGITQGIGVGLISGGVTIVGQAAMEGERPYYVDPETGQKITPNNQQQDSSLSPGIQF